MTCCQCICTCNMLGAITTYIDYANTAAVNTDCNSCTLKFYNGLKSLGFRLTNSMEHNPSWKANRSSDTQEISSILWNSKLPYRIHKLPQPVLILSQSNPVHVALFHFLTIHFASRLPFMPRSSMLALTIGFPHQNPVRTPLVSHTPPISFVLIWSPK